jgi:hypothetical protein
MYRSLNSSLCLPYFSRQFPIFLSPEPMAQLIGGYDCGSESMGFDPHSGKSKVRLFSLSILTDKIVLVVQSCKVPTHPFPGMVIPVCRITNGGYGRKTLIVIS